MAQLFLEGIQSTAAVQEVDGVPVTEEMGMYVSLKVGPAGSRLDDLVSPLLGDVATSAGGEQIVLALQGSFLSVEEDGTDQTILHKYNSLHTPFAQDPYPVSAHIAQAHGNGFADP